MSSLFHVTIIEGCRGHTGTKLTVAKRSKKIIRSSKNTNANKYKCIIAKDAQCNIYQWSYGDYVGLVKPMGSSKNIRVYDLHGTCRGGMYIVYLKDRRVTKTEYLKGSASVRAHVTRVAKRVAKLTAKDARKISSISKKQLRKAKTVAKAAYTHAKKKGGAAWDVVKILSGRVASHVKSYMGN